MQNLSLKLIRGIVQTSNFLVIGIFSLIFAGCSSPQSETAAPASSSATPMEAMEAPLRQNPTILFLGNSLAAGYGLDNPDTESFPGLVQAKIDAVDWPFEVINGGISGETTSDGLHRIDWLLKSRVDILVIELGGNDGLRGIAVETTRANLQGIIDKARSVNPDIRIVLAGMQIPPNMGQAYTSAFKDLYPQLAEENNARLIPFLLEGVGGVPSLNQSDGIHPTKEGQVIVAETVWKTLQPVLEDYLACNEELPAPEEEDAGCAPSGDVFG